MSSPGHTGVDGILYIVDLATTVAEQLEVEAYAYAYVGRHRHVNGMGSAFPCTSGAVGALGARDGQRRRGEGQCAGSSRSTGAWNQDIRHCSAQAQLSSGVGTEGGREGGREVGREARRQ